MPPIIGIDASEYQDQEPPWALCDFAIIRATIGYREDARFEQHYKTLKGSGKPFAFYHAILAHNASDPTDTHPPLHYDPARQVDALLQIIGDEDLAPIHVVDPVAGIDCWIPRVWVDVEAVDINAALLMAFIKEFQRRRPGIPIGIYSSANAWRTLIGPGHIEFADFPLWCAEYPNAALTLKYPQAPWPPFLPDLPDIWPRPLIFQFRYKRGYWPASAWPADKDLDTNVLIPPLEAPVPTPNHIKLGPHHMQGGNTTGAWLQLVPTVAKFVGDLGASGQALPGTLTMGRVVDDGLLAGQGFDVNRYTDAGADPLERAAAYIRLLHPYILANPHIQVWEGPNEQILRSNDQAEAADPAVKAKYDADRQRFMEWYADFAYAFAAGLHALGKRAGIGSWASGQPRPEHNLWRFWTRALDATVDFGAIECRHDYAGIDVTGLLRCVYDNGEFEKLGFGGVPQVISELGADVGGTGWRQLFHNDIGVCYAQLIKPWLDQVVSRPWFLGACWFTDGGRGWENYDVSGTQIVSYLAGYQAPPPEETMPISKAQQAQYLADLDTAVARLSATRSAIAMLTTDDVPAWKVGDVAMAVADPLTVYSNNTGTVHDTRANYTADMNVVGVSTPGGQTWLQVYLAPPLFVKAADVKHKL